MSKQKCFCVNVNPGKTTFYNGATEVQVTKKLLLRFRNKLLLTSSKEAFELFCFDPGGEWAVSAPPSSAEQPERSAETTPSSDDLLVVTSPPSSQFKLIFV